MPDPWGEWERWEKAAVAMSAFAVALAWLALILMTAFPHGLR